VAKQKIVILTAEANPSIEYETAEFGGMDVELAVERPESEGEAIEAVRDADAIMMKSKWGTDAVIRAAEKAKVLAVYGHGFDHIDVEACNDMGIILTNAAGICAEEVSDQAIAMVLGLNRQIVRTTIRLRENGEWNREEFLPIQPIDQQVLGIVGFGNIGRRVARKMGAGWRMKTVVYDPYASPWTIEEYGVEQVFDLDELCSRSDYLVVVVPLNSETHHMIGTEQFDNMKKSSYYVNVCRGGVTDEAALISALREGKIRGAGVDVFEQEPVDPSNPLLQMDNVITSLHLAGTSTRSAWMQAARASQQVAAVLRGEWPSAAQNSEVANKHENDTTIIARPTALAGPGA
jgi:D-3-phosphoglycerate dehydrogenase